MRAKPTHTTLIGWIALLLVAQASAVSGSGDFAVVPEMETPSGILYQSKAARAALRAEPVSAQAVERLRGWVRSRWSQIGELDLLEISRYQLEATRGWRLPAEPGLLRGEVVARDDDGRLHVEIRGPRLPARFDIVYRYLYVYGVYDPATGSLDRLVVTIRGWVEE